MLLGDLLRQAALRWPDKLAAVFSGEAATFAELDRKSLAVAQHLRRMGIGPSTRVAIVYESSLAALIYYWGVLRSGAATIDIPATGGPAALEALAEARPRALAIGPQLLRRMTAGGLQWCPEIVLSNRDASDLTAPLVASGRSFHALETLVEKSEPGASTRLARPDGRKA
jgi:acyl-coenzyme A synthetase/AMP-(fatty) acid ligase